MLVSQKWVPWYDERFRGYGHNKIEHIMHLRGKAWVTSSRGNRGSQMYCDHRCMQSGPCNVGYATSQAEELLGQAWLKGRPCSTNLCTPPMLAT